MSSRGGAKEFGSADLSMADAKLDFQLGWRWLLPALDGNRLFLGGFDGDEAEFLQRRMPLLNVVDDSLGADSWLIKSNVCSSLIINTVNLASHLNTICLLGDRRSITGWKEKLNADFPCVREYALLPSSKPRIIIPLGVSHQTVNSLRLHRSGRFVARLLVSVASLLACLGYYFPLRSRLLLIATKTSDWNPQGAITPLVSQSVAGGACALYLGSAEKNRKTVVLPLGSGTPSMIIKIAETPEARKAILKEAKSLQEMAQTPLARNIPVLLEMVENERSALIIQEYRRRKKIPDRIFRSQVIDFLARMSSLDRQRYSLSECLQGSLAMLKDISVSIGQELHPVLEWLNLRARGGALVWRHRIHGDFAPWNCSWTADGFFVFDWEASCSDGTAFTDAFRYVIAHELLMKRRPDARGAATKALNFANQVANKSGFTHLDLRCQFILWAIESLDGYRPDFYVAMMRSVLDMETK